MGSQREKVVVAMSGGVDSSVAACLLVEQGYEVIGLFMRVGAAEPVESPTEESCDAGNHEHEPPGEGADAGPRTDGNGRAPRPLDQINAAPTRTHQGCCGAADAQDARFVAGMLDIPFYALNFQKDFDRIIDYFADEYARGRTPNPCVVCNDQLKFGKIVDYADAVGAEYIATGHYARIGERDGRRVLLRGLDAHKDQSYVLFGLDRSVLDRVLFPIGELEKDRVRELAARYKLPVCDKPDSVEICFVPDQDYARVVRERRPDAFREGEVVDAEGRSVGRHRGIAHYTIGQRRGLGIAAGVPIYVTNLNVPDNVVTVGGADKLLCREMEAGKANYLIAEPDEPFRADVKIRYLHRATPAMVHPCGDGRVRVVFDEPQRAVTPGQAVVFYDGDAVVGGAWIDTATPV